MLPTQALKSSSSKDTQVNTRESKASKGGIKNPSLKLNSSSRFEGKPILKTHEVIDTNKKRVL